jgi:tetratricopeptide (TPR) repeat protein
VKRIPTIKYQELGRVDYDAASRWEADRGLQLRAGLRGGDAVIGLARGKAAEGLRWASGTAIRCAVPADQDRLRRRWYGEEVAALVKRALLLLAIQATVLLLVYVLGVGRSKLVAPSGKSASSDLVEAAVVLGLIHFWPVVLLVLIRLLSWPQLLVPTGLALLAVTAGRGLAVVVSHALAVTQSPASSSFSLAILLDPVNWALMLAGLVLSLRAWRLRRDARAILPPQGQVLSRPRLVTSRVVLATSVLFVVGLLAFVGVSGYQTSSYLLQPGVDARTEHQALLAFNEGAGHQGRNDWPAAEKSYRNSLRLWEELNRARSVPATYKINLALTLYRMGWLRLQQGDAKQAEEYYTRALALGEEAAGAPDLDAETREELAGVRPGLDALRGDRLARQVQDQDEKAVHQFEEAEVKNQKGLPEAEPLYREAISAWEAILTQPTAQPYRGYLLTRLATGYLARGHLLQRRKAADAESVLQKAISYGEKAVAERPDRPLLKHNLEVARQMLDTLHEEALQDEIDKLCTAQRFAAASERFFQSVEQQEERVRLGQDREAAVRRLAYRLERFAWFLAHCPDERVRDTRAAVKRARRATQLQADEPLYWRTLATVQYRNGDWSDSLAALDQVKARMQEPDATVWLLTAMNRYQLKQPRQADEALQKAREWITTIERQAEDKPALRFQLEMMRPSIEALRREAESLIKGRDPSGDKVG